MQFGKHAENDLLKMCTNGGRGLTRIRSVLAIIWKLGHGQG